MNQNLLNNFLLGVPMMIACLLLQALLISAAIDYYKRKDLALTSRSFWATTGVITGVMMLLTAGNLAQVAIWGPAVPPARRVPAVRRCLLPLGRELRDAGIRGDIVMSARHKLLGPLEAMNGALMIGASTATLIVAFQDSMQKTLQSREATRT